MAKKASIYSTLVLIVVAGLFAGGYLLMNRRSRMECGFCRRQINAKAHVVAEVGGRRRDVCCTHCAVTEARQEKKSLRLIAVTDYPTGKLVSPEGAWFVEDSRVIACQHDMSKMDESKHMEQLASIAARPAPSRSATGKRRKRSWTRTVVFCGVCLKCWRRPNSND